MRRRIRHGERGFNLIELMVAMMVFLIGMAGVFSMQTFGIKGTAIAADIALGTNLAASTIESMSLEDYLTLPINRTIFYDRYGVEKVGGAYFTVASTVTRDTEDRFADITVNVRWKFAPNEGFYVVGRSEADGMTLSGTTGIAGAAYSHQINLTGRVFPKD